MYHVSSSCVQSWEPKDEYEVDGHSRSIMENFGADTIYHVDSLFVRSAKQGIEISFLRTLLDLYNCLKHVY